jgi:hypothetical protein
MDLLRLDRIVSTDPTPGLERHEPGSGKQVRRKVERRDPEDPDEDTEDDSTAEQTEKHIFDTRA